MIFEKFDVKSYKGFEYYFHQGMESGILFLNKNKNKPALKLMGDMSMLAEDGVDISKRWHSTGDKDLWHGAFTATHSPFYYVPWLGMLGLLTLDEFQFSIRVKMDPTGEPLAFHQIWRPESMYGDFNEQLVQFNDEWGAPENFMYKYLYPNIWKSINLPFDFMKVDLRNYEHAPFWITGIPRTIYGLKWLAENSKGPDEVSKTSNELLKLIDQEILPYWRPEYLASSAKERGVEEMSVLKFRERTIGRERQPMPEEYRSVTDKTSYVDNPSLDGVEDWSML